MEKYIEDLKYLINKLEKIHPNLYFNVSKNDIENMIITFQKENDNINDYQFIYFIRRILKKINDAHTICLNHHQRTFPLKLKIIDGKVFIIDGDMEYKKYKFLEITEINGVEISKIIKEIEKIISYSTKEHLYSMLEYELIRNDTLKSLPIYQNADDTITYTLNNSVKLTFNSQYNYNYDFINKKAYWFDYDKENNILIINYKKCQEEKSYSMQEFIKDIDELITTNNIENIIVDIRGNMGGNSNVITPLIEYLSSGFNLVTIVDGEVFSSGRWALVNLINIGSKTLGTGIGSQINAFGYVENFVLPNTHLRITCSNTYWYYKNGKMNGIKKEQFQEFYNDSNNQQYFEESTYIPDVYIENSIEDYRNKRDRQLEEAKRIFIKNKKVI